MGKFTYKKSSTTEDQSPEPIAIVGMACRLPGDSDSPSALWELLEKGRSGRCPVPESRYNVDAFYHPDKNRPDSIHIKDGHFINENLKLFDPTFFGITPQEATTMDPQQRKLLEVAYECLEAAGVSLESVSGSKTGCFVGNFSWEYSMQREPNFSMPYDQTGFSVTMLSNRISYVFNMKGPSFTVDTACSSSMYAVHMACSSLRSGDCTAALVGGVNLILGISGQIYTSKLGVLSATSTCHTFDASADGYARADGVGALYLKKLSDAIRDGDPIRAVIRGTSINANGKTGGITHPSADGQERVIRDAYLQASLSPDDTSYFECHGTGTPVGDPIEVEAIGRVFSAGRKGKDPLLIGAVKTSLGHSEAASGLAGIMKAVLLLENNTIPATIGLVKLNPKIDFTGASVSVVTKNTPFPSHFPVKRVSINSFGFGGANAHAIVESTDSVLHSTEGYKSITEPKPHTRIAADVSPKAAVSGNSKSKFLLTLSAHDEKTLRANISRLAKVADKCDIHDLIHTLNNRRSKFFNRAYTIVQEGNLLQNLTEMGQSLIVHKSPVRRPNIGFIFTGQGAQWPTMGKDLIDNYDSCKATVQIMDKVLQSLPDKPSWTIEEVLSAPSETSTIQDPALSQPMCTALQIILVDLLASWNIHPIVTIGHSSGEIAAAYAAGYVTSAEAITLAYYRGVAVSQARTDGCMLAVRLGPHEIIQYLGGNVFIACINSPQSVTLSGDKDDILSVQERLNDAGVFVRTLKTGGKAYHSPHMKAVGAQYGILAADVVKVNNRLKKTFISSVYGKVLPSDYKLDTTYWRTNLESPVLFSQAVEKLQYLDTPVHHLVEIGPHTALEGPLRQIRSLWAESPSYTGTLLRNKNAVDCVLKTAGELYAKNYPVVLEKVNYVAGVTPATIVDLPRYAWTYAELPAEYEPRSSLDYRFRKHKRHDILGARVPAAGVIDRSWKNTLRLKDIPWLEDHQIQGKVVLAGACYVAMAIEAITQASEEIDSKPPSGCVITNMALKAAMLISSSGVDTIFTLVPAALSSVERSTKRFDFKLVSAPLGSTAWVENCCGQIEIDNSLIVKEPEWKETDQVEGVDADGSKSYGALSSTGLNYGPTFRGLTEAILNRTNGLLKAQTDLNTTKTVMSNESRYVVHPTSIDTALQLIALSVFYADPAGKLASQMPNFFEEIHLKTRDIYQDASSHGTVMAWGQSRGLKLGFGGFHILANQFKVEFKGVRLVNFDNSATESDVTSNDSDSRIPYLRAVWKPDITLLSQPFARKALDPMVAKQTNSTCLSHVQLEILEILDLLVHKDPSMSILQIGGGDLLPKLMPLLQGDSILKRYKRYVFTSLSLTGLEDTKAGLGTDSQYGVSFEALKDLEGEFDLIIVPEGNTEIEVLQAIKEHRKTTGKLLTRNNALSLSLSDGLEKQVSFHNHVLLKDGTPVEQQKERSLILVHHYTSNSKLASVLESAAREDGWDVSSVLLKDAAIPKGATVVSLADVEAEETIFENISDEEYKGLQQLVESAATCLWISSVGFLNAENPVRAMAVGLGRTVTVEQPSISFCNLDIQNAQRRPVAASEAIISLLAHGFGRATHEHEYVEDDGLLYVSRLIPDRSENATFNRALSNEAIPMARKDMALQMELGHVGDLDSIYFKNDAKFREPLALGMVEVEVKAIGMNDNDIAMGNVEGQYFSHECSGVVAKVGPGVQGLQAGDRIMSSGLGRYGTVERIEADLCCKADVDISFAELATIPAVYTTAIYALNHIARLKKGESILIHTGARGVGIAAITLAKAIGAEIYTTTSSETKRAFLQKLGVPADHIFSSEDGSFVDGVLGATDGEGVDVVISTLSGELFYKTTKCVAPAGRFIDLGRREVLDSSKLDLHFFENNATFSSFDTGKLKPKIIKTLLKEMKDLLEQGIITAIKPIRTFDVSEVAQAIRHFSEGTHTGKIVITYESPDSLLKIEPPKEIIWLKDDATYLIVGGLGGLGCSLTTWMVGRGARKFVFLSRSGIKSSTSEAASTIRYIEDAGGDAVVVTGDVSVYEDVVRAVKAAKTPIRGVIHSAMVLRDRLFALGTVKEFHEVTKPKVNGVINLHQAVSDIPLDFFIMMSSISGILGTLSQSNYCAANAVLDALSRHRHSLGLPATSIALGVIGGVGYVHEHPDIFQSLQKSGFYPLNEREFLVAMEQAMINKGFTEASEPVLGGDRNSSNYLITGLEPLRLRSMLSKGFEGSNYFKYDNRFSVLANALESSDTAAAASRIISTMGLLEEASKESDTQLTRVLSEIYIDKLAKLLLIPLDQIDLSNSVVMYGMDSMVGGELRNWLYREMRVDLSFLELLSPSVTIEMMVSNIKGLLKF